MKKKTKFKKDPKAKKNNLKKKNNKRKVTPEYLYEMLEKFNNSYPNLPKYID